MITDNTSIEDIKAIPFFFVIGRPRTGTTLIQSIFDSHPNVSIPGESPVLIKINRRYKNSEEWNKEKISELITYLKEIRKIEYWPIDFVKLESDLNKFSKDLNIETIIKIVYLNFKSAHPKQEILLIGDKNPSYSKYPKLINEIIPNAKYLIINRDYRDHFLSVKKTGLLDKLEPVTIFEWKRAYYRWKKIIQKDPQNHFSFKYEDFINNPEKYLKEICNFLGIPFYPELLNLHKKRDVSLKQYKEKNSEVFHSNVYKPINATNKEKWKRELSEKEIMIADFFAGKAALELGYTPKYKSFPFQFRLKMLTRLSVLYLYIFIRLIISILPVKIRFKLKKHLPLINKFYLLFFKD